MKKTKADRLRAAGWKIGDPRTFLGLSDEEASLIELKLALAELLRGKRQRRRLTQTDVAKRIGSSQSRIAKIEAGDATVSLDLMFRTALSLGVSLPELARSIAHRAPRHRNSRKTG